MHQGIFWEYGFQWYAGAGKGLLFASIAFCVLMWRKRAQIDLPPWRLYNFWWLAGAVAFLALDAESIYKLPHSPSTIMWSITAHISTIALVLLLLCFSFGIRGMRMVAESYRQELLISAVIGASFVGFLFLVYDLWTVLSAIVLGSVKVLLKLFGIHAIYLAPRSLVLNKFVITVAQGCSGIDSIALFTGLYALVGVLDWRRFDHKKFTLTFAPALLVLFGLNILRVFVLIAAGYYFNPQIAFSLFHTYAGMVFFIIYSSIFWILCYRWMLNDQELNRKGKSA